MKVRTLKNLLEAFEGDEDICIEVDKHSQFDGAYKALVVVEGFEFKKGKLVLKP